MHIYTHLKEESVGVTGLGVYPDGMVEHLAEELGIASHLDKLPDALSTGERQRVAIGRALMNEPKLVLFDEPTSALDTKLGEQVMELIRTEVKGRGTAAVIVAARRLPEMADSSPKKSPSSSRATSTSRRMSSRTSSR